MASQNAALFIDGDLLAAAVLKPRPTHMTLNDAAASQPIVSDASALVAKAQGIAGQTTTMVSRVCVMTPSADDSPELAASKRQVRQAIGLAGVQTVEVNCIAASSVDTEIVTRAAVVLCHQRVDHFVFVSQSPDLVPVLAVIQAQGRTSTVLMPSAAEGGRADSQTHLAAAATRVVDLVADDAFGLPLHRVPLPTKTRGSADAAGNVPASAIASVDGKQHAATKSPSATPAPVMPVVAQPPLPQQQGQQRPEPPAAAATAPQTTASAAGSITMEKNPPTTTTTTTAVDLPREASQQPPVDQMDPGSELSVASSKTTTVTTQPAAATTASPSPTGGNAGITGSSVTAPTPSGSSIITSDAAPETKPSPPAAAKTDRPAAFDMRLPPGVTAHWSEQFKEFYYVTAKDGASSTSWTHPGSRKDQLHCKVAVLQWKVDNLAENRDQNAQHLRTLRSQLDQLEGSPAPQQAAQPQQAAPPPAPQVQTTTQNVPPVSDKNNGAAAYSYPPAQQPQPQVAAPQGAAHPYQPAQPAQQQAAAPVGYPAAQPPQQAQQPAPQQHAAPPGATEIPDATLPPGWKHFRDDRSGDFFVDFNQNPPQRANERPPAF